MSNSWLSRSPDLEAQHDLPPWSSPTLSASPPIPRPITSTVVLPGRVPSSPRNRLPDSLLVLQRRQRQFEEDLQALLDAQSAGLLAGLEDGGQDDHMSDGSSTPTASSVRTGSRSRSLRETRIRKKPMGLRRVRQHILRTMGLMSAVKNEESAILEGFLEENRTVLGQVEGWQKKHDKLEVAIKNHGSDKGTHRIDELRTQTKSLETEIHDMEVRLAQMKTKHRNLKAELASLENSVEAKLSSYNSALSLLDSQIHSFLARPPQQALRLDSESAFFRLPKNRRTLAMAKDQRQQEQSTLSRLKERADMERQALEEGAVVWQGVIKEVSDYEQYLQSQMRELSNLDITASTGHLNEEDHIKGSVQTMANLVKEMDATLGRIEAKYELAESRNWKLLVCCIGAELEAFKEGRQILGRRQEELLQAAGLWRAESSGESEGEHDMQELQTFDSHDGRSESSAEEFAFAAKPERAISGTGQKSKVLVDDDDDPDPDLMVSKEE